MREENEAGELEPIIYYDLTEAPTQRQLLSYMLTLPPNEIIGSDALTKKALLRTPSHSARQSIHQAIGSLKLRGIPTYGEYGHGYYLERPMLDNNFELFDGDIKYAAESRYLSVDGSRVLLTSTEQSIFDVLLSNRNRILSWQEIGELLLINGSRQPSDAQILYILHTIRNKLGKKGNHLLLTSKEWGGAVFRDFNDQESDSTVNLKTFSYSKNTKILDRIGYKPLILSPIIYALLDFFVSNPNRKITLAEIENSIWYDRGSTPPKNIWNYIGRLRNYIEEDPKDPKYITSTTAHGGYYIFNL